jgi:hypothetical protein
MAIVNMIVGQKVILAVVPTTNNLAADLVGTPTWITSSAAVAGVIPAPGGRTAEVTAKSVGSATVTVNAVGAGALIANHTITVTANNLATAMEVTVRSPTQPTQF